MQQVLPEHELRQRRALDLEQLVQVPRRDVLPMRQQRRREVRIAQVAAARDLRDLARGADAERAKGR
jgi:hypothetical protein